VQVDIIFDDSYTVAASNLLDMSEFIKAYGPGSEALPAVEAGKVYAFNNRLAKSSDDTVLTDWFESATARPDQVSTWLVMRCVYNIGTLLHARACRRTGQAEMSEC
jgi:hypothetical protein